MYYYKHLFAAFYLFTIMQLSAYKEMHGAHYTSFFYHKYASFSTALLHILYNETV